MDISSVNFTQYRKGQSKGHYESFFQRANHPSLPLAFWIRYTIFSPHNNPEKAIGEIWAIYFDGTNSLHTSVKEEVALENCTFETDSFFVKVGDATLENGSLCGKTETGTNEIRWNLQFKGNSKPLFVLPENLYKGSFPKAKLLVGLPNAVYNGYLVVNGKQIEISNWTGSQNHNWGPKHTDNYAWGQVAGFDNSLESFFEISTARLKYGPIWTPFLTLMVLRHKEKEFRLNTIIQALKAKGKFENFTWNFSSNAKGIIMSGTIRGEEKDFVDLTYYNPPGGIKQCLNSKIASCKLIIKLQQNDGKWNETLLETKHRAAFEILH